MIQQTISTAKYYTLVNLIICSILFGLFNLTNLASILLLKLSILFMVATLAINSFVIIHLVGLAFVHLKERRKLINTCGLVLLNIPFGMLCTYFTAYTIFPPKG
ncbi:hypothetical protein [Mangrovimonas sp. YM274]|uniref:hypothetical protein n=1 Tax=Mangrovimonas sp. YM274 TaxID=3070660 RepID=UPI0027DC5E74|nr:hypothetical protein [Mangrovimonas sp. YM274]WMI68056.1 hypothetical protein RBH95_12985 [Mangrovimonas sp. YM274]